LIFLSKEIELEQDKVMPKNHQSLQETLLHTCGWCNRRFSDDNETYGFGALANPELELRGREGEFVTLNLNLTDKTIVALVAPEESPARESGYDLLFLTCSEECAHYLKDAIELERDVFSG
jgi:hypothetical protein